MSRLSVYRVESVEKENVSNVRDRKGSLLVLRKHWEHLKILIYCSFLNSQDKEEQLMAVKSELETMKKLNAGKLCTEHLTLNTQQWCLFITVTVLNTSMSCWKSGQRWRSAPDYLRDREDRLTLKPRWSTVKSSATSEERITHTQVL